MKTLIINPSYDYRGDDVIQYGVVLNIQTDDGTVLREQQFFATVSALNPKWSEVLKTDILAQISAYLNRLVEIQKTVTATYPTARTFAEAAGFLAQEIQDKLNGNS